MNLTAEQKAELQRRIDEAYVAKGDTLVWADLYTIRHGYFEELRKQTSPVVAKVIAEQQPISGEQ